MVGADIPLLLGLDYQTKWGVVLDIACKEIKIKSLGLTFTMNHKANKHWTLPIGDTTLHERAEYLVLSMNIEKCHVTDLKWHIRIVHRTYRIKLRIK